MISPFIARTAAFSASGTEYAAIVSNYSLAPTATESTVFCVMSNSGTLQNFNVRMNGAPGVGTSYTYNVMKNSVATGITVTIADAATTGSDTVNTVSYVAGDLISYQSVPTNTPATSATTFFIETNSPTQTVITGTGTAVLLTAASNYISMEGGTAQAAATDMSSIIPTDGTISSLYIKTSAIPAAGKTYTATFVKNGTDTALTAQITSAGNTANDTTHSVSVVAGDTGYWRVDPAGTPASVRFHIGHSFAPTIDGESVHFFNTNSAITSATAANYYGVGGGALTATNSNTTRSNLYGTAYDFKKLYVAVDTAPGVGKSWTVTIRSASTATAVTATIADAATSANDTTHSATPTQPSLMGVVLQGAGTPTLAPVQWSYVTYRAPTTNGNFLAFM